MNTVHNVCCVYLLATLQIANLQARLTTSQAAEASLASQLQQLAGDKAALTSANESLQQALMDKTLQAGQDAEALRQQHTKQVAALLAEQQQQLQDVMTAAAAAEEQHKLVCLQYCNFTVLPLFLCSQNAHSLLAVMQSYPA